MKKLALGTLLIAGLLAACGGGDDDGVTVIDAAGGGDTGQTACNPLGAPGSQGCLTGQKCTWIQVQDTPEALGKLGCVPDGTAALGAACTVGAVGETTGFDDCQAGLYCINSVCQDVCGFDGSAGAACQSGYNCTRYSDTFANGEDDPVAGICNPGCDPLTQIKSGTNPPAACGTNMGCYMLTSQTEAIAVCAGAGMVMHNADITGQAYANSCVPGAQPRRKDAATQTVQCGGLCKMVDVTSTTNMTDEGGQVTAAAGDKDQCVASWAAAPPADGTAGESCRYWWSREPFDNLSPYSNSVGWCYKHAAFQYDSNGDMTPDRAFPRCTTLTTGDVEPPIGNPPHNDAQYFWCLALPPPMLQGAQHNIKAFHARMEPKADRLIDWSRRAH
ncbi:MAG TPA: hypothetical protein VM261_36605 [Kofleriaceae bacterium]|nr:hypothetical protein [Kofleriaceae bacterium]